ncbi:MAG: hypothetical protein U9R17_11745, partial [Thermodesulfobacteriota bacterium]|nr:hypothetical protein [Thermodesulfobacteriota bacterium]
VIIHHPLVSLVRDTEDTEVVLFIAFRRHSRKMAGRPSRKIGGQGGRKAIRIGPFGAFCSAS